MLNQIIPFLLNQILDSPKFLKHAITLDLSRQAKSSLSATTGFICSTMVATERSLFLKKNNGINYPFHSLRLTSDSPLMSRIVFQYGVFSFFQPEFDLNN